MNPLNRISLSFTLMAMVFGVYGCDRTTPEERFLQGNAFQLNKEHTKAIEEYSEVIRSNPEFREAYIRRAESWKSTKSFKRAIADLTKALQLDSNDHVSLRKRGSYYLFLGDHDQAISDYSRAIELEPQGETYRYRAYTYAKKGEHKQAITDYTEAIRLEPEEEESNYYFRAASWRNLGDFDQALLDCEEVLRTSPDNHQALYQRGLVWLEKKEFPKAVEDFTRGIEVRGDSPLTFQHRADAYEALGEQEKAAADRKEAEKLLKIKTNK